MGGLYDILEMLKKKGQKFIPRIYKMSDPNGAIEKDLYSKFPFISEKDCKGGQADGQKYIVKEITDGQVFRLLDPAEQEPDAAEADVLNGCVDLRAIHTPGHSIDSMSFLMTQKAVDYEFLPFKTTYLFAGDLIVGAKDTYIEDFTSYMNSLYTLRDKEENEFELLAVAHSVSLNKDAKDTIIMKGPEKLASYIKYNEDKLNKLEKAA